MEALLASPLFDAVNEQRSLCTMNCDCNGNFVGFSTICALWTSEGSCVHLLWLWSKACLLLEGRRLRGLLSYSEWVTVPVFINNDFNLKSCSYWRPCGLLNYLMVCSAVNEWRLLCPSFINYDCDPKSAFCWIPCGFFEYLKVLSACGLLNHLMLWSNVKDEWRLLGEI